MFVEEQLVPFPIERLADPILDRNQHLFMVAENRGHASDAAGGLPVQTAARVVAAAADRALPAGFLLLCDSSRNGFRLPSLMPETTSPMHQWLSGPAAAVK